MAKINVMNKEVAVSSINDADYICITDIARYKSADATDDLIRNWLRNRNTIVSVYPKSFLDLDFICVHLCTSVYICVHLCTSVYICVHLCTSVAEEKLSRRYWPQIDTDVHR
jgi:hypothetical protein